MDTKIKKITTLCLFFAVIIFSGFFIGHTRAFTSEAAANDDLSQRIESLNELKTKQKFPGRMMNTLNEALPAGTWLTKLNYFRGNLSVEGFARSNNLIADFLTNIQAQRGILYNEKLLGSTRFSEGGKNIFYFRVNFSCNETTTGKEKKKDQVNETVLKKLERGLLSKNEVTGIEKRIETAISNSNLKILQWTSAHPLGQTRYGEFSRNVDVQGNYYDLTMFFNNLARLNKIVTIDELKIESLSLQEGDLTITAKFKFSVYIKDIGE